MVGDLTRVSRESFNAMADRLQAAADRQREVETLRRNLIAWTSHDLRTPLTVIGGYVESMRDGVLKPTQERLAIVGGEVQHLQRLVDDLGTLAQAEGGEMRLNREKLDPAGLLRTIAKTYQPLAEKQGITVVVDASANLPRIHADPDRLTQVFGNLVTNALRHAEAPTEVVVDVRVTDETIRAEIRDDGVTPAATGPAAVTASVRVGRGLLLSQGLQHDDLIRGGALRGQVCGQAFQRQVQPGDAGHVEDDQDRHRGPGARGRRQVILAHVVISLREMSTDQMLAALTNPAKICRFFRLR